MPRSEASGEDAQSTYSFTTQDTATSEELGRRRGPKKYNFHKRFAYQKLNGWRPILSPHKAELFLASAGVLLLALGIPILIASLNVVELRIPYGFEGPFASGGADSRQALLWSAPSDAGVQYDVTVTVPQRMDPPIYVAFELGSFFQNFRRYVRSYDPQRMHDGADSGSPVSACQPWAYAGDNDSAPINPCGQIAANFFNDSFAFLAGGEPLALQDDNIAWPSDRDHLYGSVPAVNYNLGGGAAPNRTGNTSDAVLNANEHWMVWMRPHSKVAIQKLYGQLNVALEAGAALTVRVANRYNTYAFDGPKTVVLSTNSWVGGRNNFLGACYIAVGGLCLLAALGFVLSYDMGLVWKRPIGDLANLSWLRRHAAELRLQQQLADAAAAEPLPPDGDDGEITAAPQPAPPSPSKN